MFLVKSLLTAAAMLFFAHDCDKTVVYYENENDGDPTIGIITLPASATGKVGYVHESTLSELGLISASGTPIICVSGARATTMASRQPFFPMIKYWICENGGRIFKTSQTKDCMEEIHAYTNYVNGITSEESWEALDSFAETLESAGWKVDRKGYNTMFRVSAGAIQGRNVSSLEMQVPSSLEYTYNLGFLDVQIPGLGKRSSIEWLIRAVSGTTGEEVEVSIATASSDYLYFGDDDNDIEAVSGSLEAFVASPRSEAMEMWIQSYRRSSGSGSSDRVNNRRPEHVTVPPDGVHGHAGTIFVLRRVREVLESKRRITPGSEGK